MNTDPRQFFEQMTRLFGNADSLRKIDSSHPELPPVVCFIYHDRPRAGMTTTVTYGLSEASHPNWTESKPELIVCVNSPDESWGLAVTELAEHLRGQHAFADGELFELDGPIVADSEMAGFVAHAPRADMTAETQLTLPGKTIRFIAMYPVFECEFPAVRRGDFAKIWNSPDFDPYDVERAHLWNV